METIRLMARFLRKTKKIYLEKGKNASQRRAHGPSLVREIGFWDNFPIALEFSPGIIAGDMGFPKFRYKKVFFMKIFLDTTDVNQVADFAKSGLVDGVTTNPSLIAKSGESFETLLKKMAQVMDGPISAEVVALDTEGMCCEGRHLAKIAPQIVVKIPLTREGLRACYLLSQEGIAVNITLCFSPMQALMAAKVGATYVSPFVGRLDDIGHDGLTLLEEIRTIFDNYPEITTQILGASIRNQQHVLQCAMMGIDIVTLPPALLASMVEHPLTKAGLEMFMKDWAQTKQEIVSK